ncbi:hypothetical protein GCM10011514_06390 [Emticicia aquatilis]|uniref:Uncharacterized protein n=1 Tax=Emticicia aquatilis TaxID=1537369 RepID=A0A917DJK4_9BACT|nr:hypothetical protein [Emticicia aquatilis]GGD45073.1 hypothetical protein GCM10011514_06390 [Emticicia aquatilis]
MKKTLIHVIGNIAAGKSSLIETIKPQFQDAQFFSIDEYRKVYGSWVEDYEGYSWRKLVEDLIKSPFAILETSGTSRYVPLLEKEFDGRVIRIIVKTPIDLCLKRFIDRRDNGYELAPIPWRKPVELAMFDINDILYSKKYDAEIDGKKTIESMSLDFLKIFKRA